MRKYFNKFVSIGLILGSIIFSSCKDKRINETDMVQLLAEVFITDALVTTPNYSYRFSKRDSIDYYHSIFTKLGYSEAQFTQAINYYLDNPFALDKLLDKVVNHLAKMETEKATESLREKEELAKEQVVDPHNLWTSIRNWVFPRDGEQDSLYFLIPVRGEGTYTISADVRILPDDESIEPKMIVWFTKVSDQLARPRKNIKFEMYIQDSVSRHVKINNVLADTSLTHIEGYILGHIWQGGDWQKSAEVSNIYISFTPLLDLRHSRREFHMIDTSRVLLKRKERDIIRVIPD